MLKKMPHSDAVLHSRDGARVLSKKFSASVMILCNDWGALPNRVLSAIDRRCVVDGLWVEIWIFREIISHSVYDGGAVPPNPWSEIDRAVSPLWLSDHIATLRWQRPKAS